MFYSATSNTRFSFNSVNDSPEVIYDVRLDCSRSLATLVYNNELNIHDRSLERLALVWTKAFD